MSVDLSGRWTGIFNYPRLLPATGFTATLRDHGGLLSGETEELRHDGAATLHALIEGHRQGARVTFAKLYDTLDGEHERVDYDGSVDEAALEIAGRWTIPGIWSGSFIMVRDGGVAEAVEQEAAVADGSGPFTRASVRR